MLAGGAAGAVSTTKANGPKAVPGELIVGFKPGVSDAAQADALADAGAKEKKKFKQIHAKLATAADSKLADVQKALASDPRVSYVEPNYVVHALRVPNDPLFSDLWGMQNTGQTGGTAGADIHATLAWDLETGSPNVVIASIDTGVDFTHPDLAPQQWVNPGENCGSSDPTISCAQRTDGVDNDGDGYADDWRGWNFVTNNNDPTDDNDHGTHTSGTLGAVGDNGIGVAGVDWNARIMALKFLDSTGNGTDANAISAILYAADHGARVANNSWGGAPNDQALLNAIEYGASKGMLFAAAAGNGDIFGFGQDTDTSPQYPSAFDSDAIVAVAATDPNDGLAFFSNYGAKSVDLGAPGEGIESTTPGNTYQTFDGTSMATPHVSGAAALVMSHFASATLYGTKALLVRTVDPTADLTGNSVSGGRLNVFRALSCSSSPEVVLSAPANGFTAGVGDHVPVRVIGANCAAAAGLSNVSVTVNGSPVALSASSPDNALYTGTYTPASSGPLTVTASVSAGGSTATQTVSGTAAQNYSCADVPFTFVDARPGGVVAGGASNSDDGHTLLSTVFPFTFYGQTYNQVSVSSNGFLEFGSTAGANAYDNTGIPNPANPNAVVAPFWDDLDPAAGGDVYAGVAGSAPNRVLYIEWYNVLHFSGTGTGTFEVSLHESTNEIRFHYLDTDLGNSGWNAGASATAGVENPAATLGRQVSFNQPLLTSNRAVSCTLGTAPPPPAPSITTTTLEDATNGAAYSQTLAATGGTPPYTWSLASGSLPSGIGLNSTTGAITGTPAAAPGTYSFTARATDSASQSATKALTIAVGDPLSVTTTSLSGGTVGQAYSESLAASGGKTPYTWSITSGSLPPGLTLSPASGALSGTPTTAGSFSFTVRATDSGTPARTASQALSISVVQPLTVTTSSLGDATNGQSYSASLAAAGGSPPYSWSLASGTLPSGLTLGSSTGVIGGSPSATPGTFSFVVQVTDSASQTATKSLSIAVADPLSVTTSSLSGGTVGQAYSDGVVASGGQTPYSWSVTGGSLPPGLSLSSSSGAITGTPSAGGTFSFTVQARDSGAPARTASKSLSIAIAGTPPPTLTITTSSPLPQAHWHVSYSTSLAASGGTSPYTWARASGSLPPGLTLNTSGVLSGKPTKQGTYTFTVRVTDSASATATKSFTLTVTKP